MFGTVKGEELAEIECAKGVPVHYEEGIGGCGVEGEADRAAGPHGRGFARETNGHGSVHGADDGLHLVRHVTGRNYGEGDGGAGELIEQAQNKWPSADGRENFWPVGDDATQAGSQAAGKDNGLRIHTFLN